jgi:hypothetical protein
MFICSVRAALSTALVASALIVAAAPARAELGGSPMQTPAGATVNSAAPVARAASSGGGTSGTTAAASYTVKQTTLESGTVVREYIGQDGNVFGIAWKGPFMPNLATLLGSYFPRVTNAVDAQRAERGGGRGPASVEQSGLVVHSGGHTGLFAGQAYLPQALPSGVTGSDIQ